MKSFLGLISSMAAEEVSSSSSSVVITIFLESSLILNWILFSSLAIIAALRLPWDELLILLLLMAEDPRVGVTGFKMLLTFSLEASTCPMIWIGTLVDSSSEFTFPASDFRKDVPFPTRQDQNFEST